MIYLYLAKHQKTWYEDKFSAQPLELPNYTDKKAQLRAHLKTKPEWEVFAKECSMIPSFEKSLKDPYSGCANLQEFFKLIAHEYDCYLFKTWLGRYIDKVMGWPMMGTTWSMTYNQSPVSITKLNTLPK